MKRFYRILIFFLAVFLLGFGFFAGYINYSLNKKEKQKTEAIKKDSKKPKLNSDSIL
ncbi:hypothetical protein [Robertkochia solimangrovi]|uniref:hypothetical protein n=1 Tax=Robertkochia solimangrovi TaxID=2213046 RepID=UPI0013A59F22|nr:hypothetical protein [Robertkochia solimangrovi]